MKMNLEQAIKMYANHGVKIAKCFYVPEGVENPPVCHYYQMTIMHDMGDVSVLNCSEEDVISRAEKDAYDYGWTF